MFSTEELLTEDAFVKSISPARTLSRRDQIPDDEIMFLPTFLWTCPHNSGPAVSRGLMTTRGEKKPVNEVV